MLQYVVVACLLCFLVNGDPAKSGEITEKKICLRSNEHSTCFCPYQNKPLQTFSFWNADKEVRQFTQTCEPINLSFYEDTCKIYPVNPDGETEYEYVCPHNGFLQTWGAFAPSSGNFSIRLWFRCCEVECPKWNCMWSPFSETKKEFLIPLKDAFATGTRGRYVHEDKDSAWSMKICQCDFSSREEL
ncbi:uncharacterized protein LOC143471189 [Clavelina lepadiformis]|uniref:uncharacterized protein LOC143471189 n=1 Tax=Clavelina lepadiformis TaxID=159417 RepID=UPI0040418977